MPRLLRPLVALSLIAAAAFAAAGSPAKRCITVLYPSGPDIKFDFQYYETHHIPLIYKLYGRGIAKIELRRGGSTPDGSPVPYVAVINLWIGNEKLFAEAQAKHAAELIADVPHFTNGRPVIQFDEVVTRK